MLKVGNGLRIKKLMTRNRIIHHVPSTSHTKKLAIKDLSYT